MTEQKTTYDRRLSLFDGTMVVIGGIVGAGIFLNPAIVAERSGTAGLTLASWAVGGVIALIGAMCFGELGARRPLAGGSYVYLRDTFGALPAFLYGWTYLLVVNTGGIAAVAVTFAGYTTSLLALPEPAIKPLAVAAITFLSAINYLGIRPGSITINIFTMLRILALAALILAGLMAVGGATASLGSSVALRSSSITSSSGIGVLGVALIPVLFAYGGWQHANHIAGEIRDPRRNLPRALLMGVTTVVVLYLLTNVAYVTTLGVRGLASSTAPAADTMRRVLGSPGAMLIAGGIACSTFGFLSLAILAGPRIYQAMADDGVFFRWAAKLHPRHRTPGGAIVFQGLWAALLTLSGTYGQLLDYVVFGDWIFFGLTVATIFSYRRRWPASGEPGAAHIYGYPLSPALFVLAAAYVVVSSVLSNPFNALLGGGLIASGIPAYFYWKRRRKR